MKVEVFSDKFVTKQNPSGRAVVETDDPKIRRLLGAKVVAELAADQAGGAASEEAPKAAEGKRKAR